MNKIILIIIILCAIAFIIFSSGMLETSPDSPQHEDVSDDSDVVIISDIPKARIILEAEDANEIEPPVSISSELKDASGGKCCYLGPEKVNELKETAQYKKGYQGATHPGYARYNFIAPETADYVVWVRVRWSDECGDSLDIAVDGKFLGTIQGNSDKKNPRWIWLKLGSKRIPISVPLEKDSPHTLTLANREDDLYFDQVLLLDKKILTEPVGIENNQ